MTVYFAVSIGFALRYRALLGAIALLPGARRRRARRPPKLSLRNVVCCRPEPRGPLPTAPLTFLTPDACTIVSQLIASPKFAEKRIGYLALMLLLDEKQEVLTLVTNSLQVSHLLPRRYCWSELLPRRCRSACDLRTTDSVVHDCILAAPADCERSTAPGWTARPDTGSSKTIHPASVIAYHLFVNGLQNDLASPNQYVVGLALAALGNIGSAEMARDLANDVDRHLRNPNAYVRKKAALCTIRMLKKVPDLIDTFLQVRCW